MNVLGKKVFYFGFYSEPDHIPERIPVISPATTSKMKYIAETLSKNFETVIVSPGFSIRRGISQQKEIVGKNFKVLYLESKGDGKENLTFSKILYARKQIKKFVRENLNRDDCGIIYSQPWSLGLLVNELKVKGINPVLELEELHYTNTLIPFWKRVIFRNIEKKAISSARNLILVNDILKKEIKNNSIVCHGMYRSPDLSQRKTHNREIRLLYSGAIDTERGVFLFLESLGLMPNYLTNKIIVNITGYFHGSSCLFFKEKLGEKIGELSAKGLDINFKGLLPEKEFENLISDADICISPQLVKNTFSSFSFPSKILSYLSYGKLVVSSSLPCITESPFDTFLITYKEDDPLQLKEAIIRAINYKKVFYESDQKKLLSAIKKQSETFSKGLLSMILEDTQS